MASVPVREVKYKYYWAVMRHFVPEPKKVNRTTKEWVDTTVEPHDVHYLVKAATEDLRDAQVVGLQDNRLTLNTELPAGIEEGDAPPEGFLDQADGFFKPLKKPFPWQDVEDFREENFNHIGGITNRIARTREGFSNPEWTPRIDIHYFEIGHKKPRRIEI